MVIYAEEMKMYKELFDEEKQNEMRNYFYDLALKIGNKKLFKKNEIIDLSINNAFAIVISGILEQNIISSKGYVHSMYVLTKGEIFGETDYFCGGEDTIISSNVREDAEISFVSKAQLEAELLNNPFAYRYFIHSITRKYRIIMLQLTNSIFNDSLGKIADALLRLSSCSQTDNNGSLIINIAFTHQELANNIGCSRITVTNCLNKLISEEIISYKGKKIVINDPNALKKYIDAVI
jgi:CRP-like cAMP-binding protein